jgi:hypothetical protein
MFPDTPASVGYRTGIIERINVSAGFAVVSVRAHRAQWANAHMIAHESATVSAAIRTDLSVSAVGEHLCEPQGGLHMLEIALPDSLVTA